MSRDATVLVVEDDEDLRQLMVVRLRREGIAARVAGNAEEALAAASREPPDLILLDIGLPETDGYALLALLRQRPPLARVPVIMISGFDQSSHGKRALDAGALAFVQKPPHWPDLLNLVRMALASSARCRAFAPEAREPRAAVA